MANIVTFLSYRDRAEEAAKLYCSIFPSSRITRTVAYPDIAPAPRAGAASATSS
jgi:predicted 3-demethylubiquinone-9 3-methyltransferase (glyoxalase superfamily)